MRLWNRYVVFGALAALVVGFGLAGNAIGQGVLDDAWKQLFWLTLGILVTSFVIESLLSHDLEVRRRQEDAFAFRTFVGTLLDQLAGMVGKTPAPEASAMAAAIDSPAAFAHVAQAGAQRVVAARTIDPDVYTRRYIDIGLALRNLAVGYIRIFTSSRREMADTYGKLLGLAARWEYHDALSTGFRRSTDEIPDSHPTKEVRRQETVQASATALTIVHDTATCLAELADRATRPGMPAIPGS